MVRVGPYELGETLGRGNYGLVKLAVNRDSGEKVAIKIVKKSLLKSKNEKNGGNGKKKKVVDGDKDSDVKSAWYDDDDGFEIKREIAIMRALNHRNIVALRDVLYSPKRVFMVMELVSGGELFESIVKNGKQDEEVARKYFHQLVDAVHYCHHRGVYHRDLKPENLLLGEDGQLKITDFGFSAMKDYGAHLLHTNCGSPHYCAPEVWNGTQKGYDGRKNDAWSCGIILYVQLTGKQPFYDEDDNVLLDKVNKGVVDYPDYLSEDAKDLLMHLLEMNPRKRYSLSKVKKHPWFKTGYDIDSDSLMKQQQHRKQYAKQKAKRREKIKI